jgi:cytochrome c
MLDTWLADPQGVMPGTYMVFPGIPNDEARSDLIAFLRVATAPGGDQAVVAQRLVPQQYVEGQMPEPLKSAAPGQQVTAVRHCGDSYFVTTADGKQVPYWEMNLRLKLDTRSTGPEPGKPVIASAGMMGDRAALVFSSVAELTRFVVQKC